MRRAPTLSDDTTLKRDTTTDLGRYAIEPGTRSPDRPLRGQLRRLDPPGAPFWLPVLVIAECMDPRLVGEAYQVAPLLPWVEQSRVGDLVLLKPELSTNTQHAGLTAIIQMACVVAGEHLYPMQPTLSELGMELLALVPRLFHLPEELGHLGDCAWMRPTLEAARATWRAKKTKVTS
jgi:hypothetical protein